MRISDEAAAGLVCLLLDFDIIEPPDLAGKL
jgi:hypothetical protein